MPNNINQLQRTRNRGVQLKEQSPANIKQSKEFLKKHRAEIFILELTNQSKKMILITCKIIITPTKYNKNSIN